MSLPCWMCYINTLGSLGEYTYQPSCLHLHNTPECIWFSTSFDAGRIPPWTCVTLLHNTAKCFRLGFLLHHSAAASQLAYSRGSRTITESSGSVLEQYLAFFGGSPMFQNRVHYYVRRSRRTLNRVSSNPTSTQNWSGLLQNYLSLLWRCDL